MIDVDSTSGRKTPSKETVSLLLVMSGISRLNFEHASLKNIKGFLKITSESMFTARFDKSVYE